MTEIRREIKVKTDNFQNKRSKIEKVRKIVFDEVDKDVQGIEQVKIEVIITGPPNAFRTLEGKGLVADIMADKAPQLELVLRGSAQQTLDDSN